MSFAGLDFKAGKDTFVFESDNGELTSSSGYFTVPVPLPQWATVTEAVFYFTKTGVSSMFCRLVKYQGHTNGGNWTELINTNISSASAATPSVIQNLISTTSDVVDNSEHSYFLIVNPLPNSTLLGARVGFTRAPTIPTSFVPVTPGRVYDSRWPVFGATKITNG